MEDVARGPELQDRFTIEPPRPYSLALTAQRFTRFPEAVDRFEKGTYRRLLAIGRGLLLVSVRQSGPPAQARLAVELLGRGIGLAQARPVARQLVCRTLGAGEDVRPFYRAVARDPWLSETVRRFRGLRIAGTASLWEAIVTAVLSQQIRLSFAYSIRKELSTVLGRRARLRGETFFAFPTPTAIARAEGSLRGFRLSQSKARALAATARAFLDGTISEERLEGLPEEEAIERLSALPGVGRWTAEIALLRGLQRVDVFPAADLGVVAHLAQGLLGKRQRSSEHEMRAFAERWRPYRGLALVYAYAELARREGIQKVHGQATK